MLQRGARYASTRISRVAPMKEAFRRAYFVVVAVDVVV